MFTIKKIRADHTIDFAAEELKEYLRNSGVNFESCLLIQLLEDIGWKFLKIIHCLYNLLISHGLQ